jgi:hypothetical protein
VNRSYVSGSAGTSACQRGIVSLPSSKSEIVLVGENRHFAEVFVEPDPGGKLDAGATIHGHVLPGCQRAVRYGNRTYRSSKERTGLQGCLTGPSPKDETVARYHEHGAAVGIVEPAQYRGNQRHPIALGATRQHAEVGLTLWVDLAAKIIERHQKRGREDICLMFDLAIIGIPAYDILIATANSLRICQSVQ